MMNMEQKIKARDTAKAMLDVERLILDQVDPVHDTRGLEETQLRIERLEAVVAGLERRIQGCY